MLIIEIIKNGIFQGSLILLLAIAFSLVYATTRVFHIALGAIYLCAGYTAVALGEYAQQPLYTSVFVAIVISFVVSFLLDRTLYAQFDRAEASGSVRLIGSLSVLIIISGIIAWVCGNQLRLVSWFTDSSMELHGVVLTSSDFRYASTALLCVTIITVFINRSHLGLRIRAYASNRVLAQVLGHNLLLSRMMAILIASFLIGTAATYQSYRTGIDPSSAWPVTIAAAVATIIGNRSIVLGPAVASLGIGILRSVTTYFVSDIWSDCVVYIFLLIVMLIWAQDYFSHSEEAS